MTSGDNTRVAEVESVFWAELHYNPRRHGPGTLRVPEGLADKAGRRARALGAT